MILTDVHRTEMWKNICLIWLGSGETGIQSIFIVGIILIFKNYAALVNFIDMQRKILILDQFLMKNWFPINIKW